MKEETIILELLSLKVDFKVNDDGIRTSGNCTGDSLKRKCPYCQRPNCYLECDQFLADENDITKETYDECNSRRKFNTCIDFMKTAIVQHGFTAVDIEDHPYQMGWLEACCRLEEMIPTD